MQFESRIKFKDIRESHCVKTTAFFSYPFSQTKEERINFGHKGWFGVSWVVWPASRESCSDGTGGCRRRGF